MRRIPFIFLSLIFISPLAIAQTGLPSYGQSGCYERLRPEVVKWTNTLNREANEQLVPTPKSVLSRRESAPESFFRANIAAQLVMDVAQEVEDQAAVKLTEFLYFVRDEGSIPGSVSNASVRDIPGWVVNAMCVEQCSQVERERFRALAQKTLLNLRSENVPRMSLNEVTEEVRTHLEGLESVAQGIDSRKASALDFRLLYQQTMLTPTGRLLAIDSLMVLMPESANLRVLLKKLSPSLVRRAIVGFYQDFSVSRYETRKAWLPSQAMMSSRGGLASDSQGNAHNPYLWLSRYLETAPLAVATVLRTQPKYKTALCEILFGLDDYLFQTKWKSSFDQLWNGIKIPLWVVGIAVIPVVASGAPLAVMWVGLMVLKASTVQEMAENFEKRNESRRQKRFHLLNLVAGVASPEALATLTRYDQDIIAAERELGLTLAIEIGSFGLAQALAAKTMAAFKRMSDADLVAVLGRQLQTKSARYAVLELLDRHVPAEAIKKVRGMSYEQLNLARVRELVKTTSKTDLEKIFFSQRDVGFARNLFLTGLGADLATSFYQAGTEDYFKDLSPFRHLADALAH